MKLLGTILSLSSDLVDTCYAAGVEPAGAGDAPKASRLRSVKDAGQDESLRASQPGEGHGSCGLCGVEGFASREEQIAHYKGRWHVHNVRSRVRGRAPISEDEYAALFESRAEDGSSSSGESTSGSEDEVDDLYNASRSEPSVGISLGSEATGVDWRDQAARAVLVAPGQPPRAFVLYRAALPPPSGTVAEAGWEAAALRAVAGGLVQTWVVVLARGGHFAAAVFEVAAGKEHQQRTRSGAVEDTGVPGVVCLAHRAIHRYVVRAKQGGRQSVKDQAKPGIKSMGSQLRRHNEEALARDITNVLLSWQAHVARAHRILLQVSRADRPAVLAGLPPSDPRLTRVPFSAGRPTYAATVAAAAELLRVRECALPGSSDPSQAASTLAKDRAAGGAVSAASGAEGDGRAARAGRGVGAGQRGAGRAGAETSGRKGAGEDVHNGVNPAAEPRSVRDGVHDVASAGGAGSIEASEGAGEAGVEERRGKSNRQRAAERAAKRREREQARQAEYREARQAAASAALNPVAPAPPGGEDEVDVAARQAAREAARNPAAYRVGNFLGGPSRGPGSGRGAAPARQPQLSSHALGDVSADEEDEALQMAILMSLNNGEAAGAGSGVAGGPGQGRGKGGAGDRDGAGSRGAPAAGRRRGGAGTGAGTGAGSAVDPREDRRRRMLEAAEARMRSMSVRQEGDAT